MRARRMGWLSRLLVRGIPLAILLAPVTGEGAGKKPPSPPAPSSTAKSGEINLLRGAARPAGGFKPAEKCTPAKGGAFRLRVKERQPGDWGGCCVELSTPVTLVQGACPKVELELAKEESEVHIKFESGPFGAPTQTAWLYKGGMDPGSQVVEATLQDGNHGPSPAITVQRMCVAIVGPDGPRDNKLMIKRAVASAEACSR